MQVSYSDFFSYHFYFVDFKLQILKSLQNKYGQESKTVVVLTFSLASTIYIYD